MSAPRHFDASHVQEADCHPRQAGGLSYAAGAIGGWDKGMDKDDGERGDERRVVTTEGQTDEQRRQTRQADRIRDLERLMRGAAAFSRRGTD